MVEEQKSSNVDVSQLKRNNSKSRPVWKPNWKDKHDNLGVVKETSESTSTQNSPDKMNNTRP
jgi:hypothetical protein